MIFFPTQIQLFPSTVTTVAGEWGEFTLPDGTQVDMGPNSRIKVAFAADVRMIEHIYGEAIYAVQHDPLRPFLVRTEVAIVEAIGTRFGIEHLANRTVVTMSEGEVGIERRSRPWNRAANEKVRAMKGEQVVVEPGQPMIPRPADVEAWLAWQHRHIYFDRVPVEDAIAQFNRRNVMQLAVPADAEALRLTVNGYFKLDNPSRFATYLDTELRKRKERRSKNE